jgi:gluconate 2-dehydrogenase gamma chain
MKEQNPSRRAVLASAAIIPVATLTSSAQQTEAQGALTAAQMNTLKAFVDRLIPADELGPGAVEAGAHNYISIQLAGYLAAEKEAFAAGLDGLRTYAVRVAGSPFAELSAQKRDEIMTAMDTGKADGFTNARNFFTRARRLTLEGTFGDPHYGGNNNGIGWDIIRYPGPRPAVGPEEQRLGTPATPYRKSAWGNAEHEH